MPVQRIILTKAELCKATDGKLTMWTIGELTRRGEIPYIKLGSMRRYLYDYDRVLEWLSSLQGQQPQGIRVVK